jgi:hypothetical protein
VRERGEREDSPEPRGPSRRVCGCLPDIDRVGSTRRPVARYLEGCADGVGKRRSKGKKGEGVGEHDVDVGFGAGGGCGLDPSPDTGSEATLQI